MSEKSKKTRSEKLIAKKISKDCSCFLFDDMTDKFRKPRQRFIVLSEGALESIVYHAILKYRRCAARADKKTDPSPAGKGEKK